MNKALFLSRTLTVIQSIFTYLVFFIIIVLFNASVGGDIIVEGYSLIDIIYNFEGVLFILGSIISLLMIFPPLDNQKVFRKDIFFRSVVNGLCLMTIGITLCVLSYSPPTSLSIDSKVMFVVLILYIAFMSLSNMLLVVDLYDIVAPVTNHYGLNVTPFSLAKHEFVLKEDASGFATLSIRARRLCIHNRLMSINKEVIRGADDAFGSLYGGVKFDKYGDITIIIPSEFNKSNSYYYGALLTLNYQGISLDKVSFICGNKFEEAKAYDVLRLMLQKINIYYTECSMITDLGVELTNNITNHSD